MYLVSWLTKGSQTPLVQIARKHLGEQRSVHIRNPSEDSQHAVKQAQEKLFRINDKTKEEEFTAMATVTLSYLRVKYFSGNRITEGETDDDLIQQTQQHYECHRS